MTQEFIPSLSYNCKGLVFYNSNGKYSDYIYIIPRDERIVCKSQDIVDQEIKESHPHLMMKHNSAPLLLNSNVINNFNSNSNNNSNSISNNNSNRSSNNTESLDINNVKAKKI